MDFETYKILREYLAELGVTEYRQQRKADKRKSFRYSPSDYHRQLISYLDQDNEAAFKALKLVEGPYSALGY